MDQIPHARALAIAQAPPARHPRSASEFLREHLPRNAAAKDEENAGQARAIRHARSATLWPSWKNRQKRFDKIPQRIWKQRGGHAPSRYLAEDQVSEVLLHALRTAGLPSDGLSAEGGPNGSVVARGITYGHKGR